MKGAVELAEVVGKVKRLHFHVAIPGSRPRALRVLNAFGTARR